MCTEFASTTHDIEALILHLLSSFYAAASSGFLMIGTGDHDIYHVK